MGTLCRSSVILNGEARHPYANSAFPYDVLRLHASPSVNYIIAHIPQKYNTFCKNFTFLFEHRCEEAYFVENTPFEIVLLWTILIIFDYLRLFCLVSHRVAVSIHSTPLPCLSSLLRRILPFWRVCRRLLRRVVRFGS